MKTDIKKNKSMDIWVKYVTPDNSHFYTFNQGEENVNKILFGVLTLGFTCVLLGC